MAVTRIVALVTILIAYFVCAAVAGPKGRLLEGEDATAAQYPWVVSVRVDNAHVAVGNIISSSHILTTAHVLSELGTTAISASRVSVRVGSINQFAGGSIVNIKSILLHSSFGNFLHDIAIITLPENLTFTNKIAAIPLNNGTDALAEGTNVTLAGWGLRLSGSSPYKLQQTKMQVMSSEECEYQAGYGYNSVLCLEHGVNQGISTGDDGAGVVSNNTLVGVASFFFGTGGTSFPDVSAKVSYYYSWIQKTINPSKAYL